MKTNEITIKIQDEESFWDETRKGLEAIDSGEQERFSEDVLGFQSIDQMRSVLAEKRLELLRAIRKYEPDSIYALAKLVNRSPANVNQDVQKLHQLGLVRLEEQNDARNSVKPIVFYDKMHVEIGV